MLSVIVLCHYAECHILLIGMLHIIMLNIIKLTVVFTVCTDAFSVHNVALTCTSDLMRSPL
jgi:hypothetical protein